MEIWDWGAGSGFGFCTSWRTRIPQETMEAVKFRVWAGGPHLRNGHLLVVLSNWKAQIHRHERCPKLPGRTLYEVFTQTANLM